MIKANSIGATMTRKIKRIGCSTIKDLIEQNKIQIHDAATIVELSTFESNGSSYEASNGNHDDLVMNLVMFAWFTTIQFFNDLTDIDVKRLLYSEKIRAMEEDVVPVGILALEKNNSRYTVEDGLVWEKVGY
jgi:hypothetical protein